MILAALDDAGGVEYLKKQAETNPSAFLALVGKILPRDAKVELAHTTTLEELVAASYQPRER